MNHEDYRRLSRRDELLSDIIAWAIIMLIVAAILGGSFALTWYQAGVQQRLYQREGIEVSRWELLMGAKPAEREVHVR